MGFNLMAFFSPSHLRPKHDDEGREQSFMNRTPKQLLARGRRKKTNVWFYWAVFLTDRRGNMQDASFPLKGFFFDLIRIERDLRSKKNSNVPPCFSQPLWGPKEKRELEIKKVVFSSLSLLSSSRTVRTFGFLLRGFSRYIFNRIPFSFGREGHSPWVSTLEPEWKGGEISPGERKRNSFGRKVKLQLFRTRKDEENAIFVLVLWEGRFFLHVIVLRQKKVLFAKEKLSVKCVVLLP